MVQLVRHESVVGAVGQREEREPRRVGEEGAQAGRPAHGALRAVLE